MIRSVYLTERENTDLLDLAGRRGIAPNALVRVALRLVLGLAVPEWADELREKKEASTG